MPGNVPSSGRSRSTDWSSRSRRVRWRLRCGRQWPILRLRLLLYMPAWQFIKRLGRTPDKNSGEGRRQICILTRQRIVGRTNGSSRYLLDIAAYLTERGADVHLVVPSPITMGRLPFLRLSDDMAIFRSIRFRGTSPYRPLHRRLRSPDRGKKRARGRGSIFVSQRGDCPPDV